MKNQNEDGTWDLATKLDKASHDQLRSLWNVSALRTNAANMGLTPEEAARAEFWTYEQYEAAVAKAAEKPQDGDASPEADPNAGTGSTPIPASIGGQQAQGVGLGATGNGADTDDSNDQLGDQTSDPTPWKEGVRAFADPELGSKSYEDWTNDQLKAEITKRNELRDGVEEYADDEPMKTDGVKADLVQRLTEDDEADAPE